MNKLVTAIVASSLLTGSALAQPRAEMCGVTFVRTPDDVRHEIERWLGAEPRCSTPLELRVIPTEGGLYVWAQRPDGRVHERMVPDAQTAGVLVASWAADDWTDTPPLSPVIAPIISTASPPVAPQPFVDERARSRTGDEEGGKRWLAVGAMGGANGSGGARVTIDLFARDGWRLGVAGQYTSARISEQIADDPSLAPGEIHYLSFSNVRDAKLLVTASHTMTFGAWGLTLAGGIGVMHTSAHYILSAPYQQVDNYMDTSTDDSSLALELSARIVRRLTSSAALELGPVATKPHEEWDIGWAYPVYRRSWETMWNAALRIAL